MCISQVTHVKEKITAAGGKPSDKDSPRQDCLMPHIGDLDNGPIIMLKSKARASQR